MHTLRFLLLFGFLFCLSIPVFSQDSIRTNVRPELIGNTLTLLIQKGNVLVREQYRDWRSNYWFFWTDTVTETENGMLTGRLGTIDPKEFAYVESCDPVIRRIRNETLMWHLGDRHDETAGLIPRLSDEDLLAIPTHEDEVQLCPDVFEAKARRWYGIKNARLQTELKGRSVRMEWVQSVIEKGETQHLDSTFFAGFLRDFSWNPVDGNTFLLLAEHRTEALLEACGRLSENHFRSVKLAVSVSCRKLDTAAAVERLKGSKVKGGRKRKLAREMKQR